MHGPYIMNGLLALKRIPSQFSSFFLPAINLYRFLLLLPYSMQCLPFSFYVYLRVYVVFHLISIPFRYLNSEGVERKHFSIIPFVAVHRSFFRCFSPVFSSFCCMCCVQFHFITNSISNRDFCKLNFCFVVLVFHMYACTLSLTWRSA